MCFIFHTTNSCDTLYGKLFLAAVLRTCVPSGGCGSGAHDVVVRRQLGRPPTLDLALLLALWTLQSLSPAARRRCLAKNKTKVVKQFKQKGTVARKSSEAAHQANLANLAAAKVVKASATTSAPANNGR